MSVYKRDGGWEFRKTIRGVRYYERIPEAKSQLQAEVAGGKILQAIYEGRYGREGQEIGSTDFVDFCRTVYLPDAKERLRQWRAEEYKVETLCRYFRGKRLRDITLIAIQGYRRKRLAGDSRMGRPRQASTVKGEISTLSNILNMAIDNELLGLNPCRKIKWGRNQTKSERDRVLSEEEESRLMPQLERFPEAHAATIIALNTGLRRMGILQSKVSDFDRQARTLAYIAKGGARKKIPLNAVAFSVIEKLVEHATPDGYLFHKRTGHIISASNGAFQLSCRRAGIEDLHFHDLRHTFSTRVRNHTDAFTVRDLMAHADLKTTGIYVTSQMEEMRSAVEMLCEKKVLAFPARTG